MDEIEGASNYPRRSIREINSILRNVLNRFGSGLLDTQGYFLITDIVLRLSQLQDKSRDQFTMLGDG